VLGALAFSQPGSERPLCKWAGSSTKGPCVRRFQPGGQGREEVGVFGCQRCHPANKGDRVPSSHLGEEGNDFVSHPVAAKAPVGVGRVGDSLHPPRADQRSRLRSPEREDRTAHASQAASCCPHARKAVGPGSSQKVEQHGLGLVVSRVANEYPVRKTTVTCSSSARLKVRAGLHGQYDGPEAGAELACSLGDKLAFPLAVGPQAVVHMDNVDDATSCHRQPEHRKGIGATRDGTNYCFTCRRELAPAK